MTAEENKTTFRRYVEEVSNQGNLDLVVEIFDRYISHQPDGHTEERGPEDVKRFMGAFHQVFPDFHSTIEDQIAEGDKVATRWTMRGTHQGEFRGAAPTTNRITVTGIGIFRFSEEGKVVESWDNFDQLGMMQQLGVIPMPEQAGDAPPDIPSPHLPTTTPGEDVVRPEQQETSQAGEREQKNKALIRRYFEEIDAERDVAVLDEFLAPDFVDHSPSPGFTPDFEGMRQSFAHFLAATPDGYHNVEGMIAEGDKVVTRIYAYGTQTGELFGIPPTGKRMTSTGIAIHRIADGKIVEHWGEVDTLGVLQQLGVIPPPEQGEA